MTTMYASVQVCVISLIAILTCNYIQAQNITAMQTKDLRGILSNRLLVTRQIDCVLGKAQCDRLGGQLKKAIPEVFNRKCARCTSAQATNAKKLINFIQINYPVAYREILNKYRTIKAVPTKLQQPKITAKPTKVLSPLSIPKNSTTNATGLHQTKILSPQSMPKNSTTNATGLHQTKILSPQSMPRDTTAKVAPSRRTNMASSQSMPRDTTAKVAASRRTNMASSQSMPRDTTAKVAASRRTNMASSQSMPRKTTAKAAPLVGPTWRLHNPCQERQQQKQPLSSDTDPDNYKCLSTTRRASP